METSCQRLTTNAAAESQEDVCVNSRVQRYLTAPRTILIPSWSGSRRGPIGPKGRRIASALIAPLNLSRIAILERQTRPCKCINRDNGSVDKSRKKILVGFMIDATGWIKKGF